MAITLGFDPAGGKDSLSLSGVGCRGDYLFFAPDEGAKVVRLRRLAADRYGEPESFELADLLSLPGDPGDEADLEGLALVDDAIWLAGSHGAVRTRVKPDAAVQDVAATLAKVKQPSSRCLLARIPLRVEAGGTPAPVRELAGRRAARLPAQGQGSLRATLEGDPHLGPALAIPSKDNGLDIEGLAVAGDRVLLGLRGPVLRGWAVILELAAQPDPADPERLRLTPVPGADGALVAKHFLDLDGLGVRDLEVDGEDLLILTGPTMLLDGPARILRVPGVAASGLPPAVHRGEIEVVVADLPVGQGADHPEALSVLTDPAGGRQLIVVYDSPSEARAQDGAVRAETETL